MILRKTSEKGVAEITNGNGFDVTIEAVGLPSTFQNCIDACCFGGRMVLIGVGKKNLDFNFTLIQKKELNVFGSRNALKKDFLELIDIVNAGKAPPTRSSQIHMRLMMLQRHSMTLRTTRAIC